MSTHNHEECADCIAREAAARREALLAFADTRGVNVGDEDSEWLRGYRQAQRECLRDATDAALAEPERDEEGGMLGGSPNFKHRDATVPMDDDFPSEVARALLDDERLSDEGDGR